jgi:hypothetical protein
VDAENRRIQIFERLIDSDSPITGTELSKLYDVSRQVIVQDIAILRASGKEILATPNGYLIVKKKNNNKIKKTYAVKHDMNQLEKELLIVVDAGGTVIDVCVEHAIYGEIRGTLMIDCREAVYSFIGKLEKTGAKPLNILTNGVHLHVVEADNETSHSIITKRLRDEGILLESIKPV